jgi:hypothetical protein
VNKRLVSIEASLHGTDRESRVVVREIAENASMHEVAVSNVDLEEEVGSSNDLSGILDRLEGASGATSTSFDISADLFGDRTRLGVDGVGCSSCSRFAHLNKVSHKAKAQKACSAFLFVFLVVSVLSLLRQIVALSCDAVNVTFARVFSSSCAS